MRKSLWEKLWDLAVSPAVFVVLCILWCANLGIGSILAFQRDPNFWMKMDSMPLGVWLERFAPKELPQSLWVYILVVLTWLVMISLITCTIGWFIHRRARKRTFGEVFLHLGFGLVFAGFVAGSGWGVRVPNVSASAGEVVEISDLGLKLKLESIENRMNEAGERLDTVSNLTLTDLAGNTLVSGSAKINHPLIHGATVVYPLGGETRTVGSVVEAGALGLLEVREGRETPLPDGRVLRVAGSLAPGQRYQRWVGPGTFVTIGKAGGQDENGVFLGEFPLFRRGRLGPYELEWRSSVDATVGGFNVHHDPGIQLVLAGALLLTLGTFWALGAYLKREG